MTAADFGNLMRGRLEPAGDDELIVFGRNSSLLIQHRGDDAFACWSSFSLQQVAVGMPDLVARQMSRAQMQVRHFVGDQRYMLVAQQQGIGFAQCALLRGENLERRITALIWNILRYRLETAQSGTMAAVSAATDHDIDTAVTQLLPAKALLARQ